MGDRVLFLSVDALYPECRVLTREHPAIGPFQCLRDAGCHLGGARCMETLARRLAQLFDREVAIEQIVVHWLDPQGRPRGAAFDRAFSAPRVASIQPRALRRYLALGTPLRLPADLVA